MARPSLTRTHRVLLGVVAAGACLISGIGFAGSYNAVRELAVQKGFGAFSYAFPIGVDAGIVVLLALDLVLTWLRIPFPLLRQTAWLLTGATIAFNAAASWGDPLGMGMHAVIPVLFIVVVEASRHAVGRIAAITADRYMESVRLMRWLLSPVPTFRLWRRMKLWELRSYDETVRLEQNRLVYRAQLRFRYGRGWRRSAPFEALLPLKLAKYGVPLDPTVLDRIDGPLPVAGPVYQVRPEVEQAGPAGPAGQPTSAGHPGLAAQQQAGADEDGIAPPPVSAAVAVPTLAKLAAVRRRDAQDPEQAAQPVHIDPSGELNVWVGREPSANGVAPQGAYGTRVPGQSSPWFKPPRPMNPGERGPVSPVQGAPAGARRPGQGGPGQGGPGRPVGQDRPGVPGASGEPMRIGPRPIRLEEPVESVSPMDLLDAEQAGVPGVQPGMTAPAPEVRQVVPAPTVTVEQLPLDQAEAAEEYAEVPVAMLRHGGAQLDVDECFEALKTYIDEYDQKPTQQQLADFLTEVVGLIGSRPDGSVSSKDLDRIMPELGRRYATLGRD